MKRGSDLRMRGEGIGSVHQFVCMRCNHPRPTTGRKFARWRGTRAYVCAECAQALADDAAARAAMQEKRQLLSKAAKQAKQ